MGVIAASAFPIARPPLKPSHWDNVPVLDAPALNKREALTTRTLTVETSLYLVICAASLAVRLLAISGAQLTLSEATQALPAYRLAQGSGGVAAAGGVSPGLLSLQALAFWLFADNDAWARLPVVLLTAAYPLAFWLLRPVLGKTTAVVAAALLLVSPVWVEAGALGLGGEVSMVAFLFALGLAVQAVVRDEERWLDGAGIALGLALAAGTEGWAALGLAALILSFLARRASGGQALLPPRRWRRLGLAAGLCVLLLGTAGTCHPMGLQMVLDQAVRWAVTLAQRQPLALPIQTLLLACYEPLLLFLGMLTVALVPPSFVWRRSLYLWAGLALFLTLASGERGGGVLLLLPALAILAAEALAGLARRLRQLPLSGLLQAVGAIVVLAVYGYIALAGFAVQGQLAYLVLAVTAVGIGGALLGLVAVRQSGALALALLTLAAVMVLGSYQVAATWHGAWQRRSLPQELTHGTVSDANLADLAADIESISWSRTGAPSEVHITIEDEAGALVAWYTRDLGNASWVRKAPADAAALCILTVLPQLETAASQYVGQDYRVSASWWPYFRDVRAFLRWLIFREADGVAHHNVTLWVLSAAAAGG